MSLSASVIHSDPIACNFSFLRSVLEVERSEASMGRRHGRHGRKGRHETWRICSRMLRWWFRMAGTNGLFLLVLLPGCRSAEEGYIAQATNHATTMELEQLLGHPSHKQVRETGDRLWLYRREGSGTGGRDFPPFCQDLWLTFDRNGVLRAWQKQRC